MAKGVSAAVRWLARKDQFPLKNLTVAISPWRRRAKSTEDFQGGKGGGQKKEFLFSFFPKIAHPESGVHLCCLCVYMLKTTSLSTSTHTSKCAYMLPRRAKERRERRLAWWPLTARGRDATATQGRSLAC